MHFTRERWSTWSCASGVQAVLRARARTGVRGTLRHPVTRGTVADAVMRRQEGLSHCTGQAVLRARARTGVGGASDTP